MWDPSLHMWDLFIEIVLTNMWSTAHKCVEGIAARKEKYCGPCSLRVVLSFKQKGFDDEFILYYTDYNWMVHIMQFI